MKRFQAQHPAPKHDIHREEKEMLLTFMLEYQHRPAPKPRDPTRFDLMGDDVVK